LPQAQLPPCPARPAWNGPAGPPRPDGRWRSCSTGSWSATRSGRCTAASAAPPPGTWGRHRAGSPAHRGHGWAAYTNGCWIIRMAALKAAGPHREQQRRSPAVVL